MLKKSREIDVQTFCSIPTIFSVANLDAPDSFDVSEFSFSSMFWSMFYPVRDRHFCYKFLTKICFNSPDIKSSRDYASKWLKKYIELILF